jgi:hypothetical protein
MGMGERGERSENGAGREWGFGLRVGRNAR